MDKTRRGGAARRVGIQPMTALLKFVLIRGAARRTPPSLLPRLPPPSLNFLLIFFFSNQ